MALPHRHREGAFPDAVELAEPRVAIAIRVPLDVLVPQDRQRDVLALELAVNASPVRLGVAALARPGAGGPVELRFQFLLGHRLAQWPAQPGCGEALERLADRRWRNPQSPRDLSAGYPAPKPQPNNLAHMAHRDPLCWHPIPPSDRPKERTLCEPAEQLRAIHSRAASSRNGGRQHLGTLGGFKSECRAASCRNPGRLRPESARLRPESASHRPTSSHGRF